MHIDIVGDFFMVEDGPGDPEDVAFIKEITGLTNDRVAELFLGMGANSAALGTHLYQRFEIEINQYFVSQGITPVPADIENEALRFAIWTYLARDLDDKVEDKEQRTEQMKDAKIKNLKGGGDDEAQDGGNDESQEGGNDQTQDDGYESDDLYNA